MFFFSKYQTDISIYFSILKTDNEQPKALKGKIYVVRGLGESFLHFLRALVLTQYQNLKLFIKKREENLQCDFISFVAFKGGLK